MSGTPMQEGQLAAANGEPKEANPYPAETRKHDEWLEGWEYYHSTTDDGEINDEEL